MGRLEGKVVLITGAARGQGRAQAVRVGAEGGHVIAVDICADIASNSYRSWTLSDSEHRPAGGRERSSAARSGGQPRRPVTVFPHPPVAAPKPPGNPPSLPRAPRRGPRVAPPPPSAPSPPRCHTPPSPHPPAHNAQHQKSTKTQYRLRELTI